MKTNDKDVFFPIVQEVNNDTLGHYRCRQNCGAIRQGTES